MAKQTQEEIKYEKDRAEVMKQELSARSWKAHYEKMYYTIESGKIEEEYERVVKENMEKLKEHQEKMQKVLSELQVNTGQDGQLNIKPVAEA